MSEWVIQNWRHRKGREGGLQKCWQKITKGGKWGRFTLIIVTSPSPLFILIIYSISPYSQITTPSITFSMFLMTIKNLQRFSLSIVTGNCNRKHTKLLSFLKEVVHFVAECGIPLSNPFNIFEEHLSLFLQKYFCGPRISIFAKNLSAWPK